jgi:hypothetical protein
METTILLCSGVQRRAFARSIGVGTSLLAIDLVLKLDSDDGKRLDPLTVGIHPIISLMKVRAESWKFDPGQSRPESL